MKAPDFSRLDSAIGGARIGLSLVTLLSIYIDPATGGLFGTAPSMLAVLTFHLAYGIALYTAIESGIAPDRLPANLDSDRNPVRHRAHYFDRGPDQSFLRV